MPLNFLSVFFRSLRDDYQAHLTPELQRMARAPETPNTFEGAPVLQEMEKQHGRALLKLETGRGSWPFVRWLLASTKPHFWRALVYMLLTTAAAATPPLLT